MLKFLLICILFWVCVTSQTGSQLKVDENLKQKFEEFIIEYNRQYKNEKEKAIRFSNFMNNTKKAEELNKLYKEELFGTTKFSDWSEEELKGMLGFKPVKNAHVEGQVPLQKFNQGQAPAAWDWRKHNAVTPVKNQSICGSCWAFSSIGNIEGQYAIKHKKLVSLSEQQLVDCTTDINDGCAGGNMEIAFTDLEESSELVESESAYPYEAIDDSCRYNKQKGVAKVIGYNFINSTNEDELKQAVYEHGPLSFGMAAERLIYWTGNIFPGCAPDSLKDHALVLVGYGTSESGEKYWIVKNSWGADWNGDGYFKMKRGIDICDILSKSGEEYWIVKNSWGANWHGDGYFKMKRGINICNILSQNNFVTSQVA